VPVDVEDMGLMEQPVKDRRLHLVSLRLHCRWINAIT
jgi:hypothetical protein